MNKLILVFAFLYSTLIASEQTVIIKKEYNNGGNFLGSRIVISPEMQQVFYSCNSNWVSCVKQIESYEKARTILQKKMVELTAQYQTNKSTITNVIIHKNGIMTYDKIIGDLTKKKTFMEDMMNK